MIRKYAPNPSNPNERRRLVATLSALLFVAEVTGAVAFAIAITAIVARHAGVYPGLAVVGLFTFVYAAVGMVTLHEYRES